MHTKEGNHIFDPFSGSGSFGEAAVKNNRLFTLVDKNPKAIEIMRNRFLPYITEDRPIQFHDDLSAIKNH